MIVGVPRESYPGERRVALVPAVVPGLLKAGLEVVVEAGAGAEAGYPDADYTARGAQVVPGARRRLPGRGHHRPGPLSRLERPDRQGRPAAPAPRARCLIGFLRPLGSIETIREIAEQGVTSFSVELMPRTTRAQSMDALSSMATICGYKAVILAADTLPRLFPMLTTAAGTITPGAGPGDRGRRGRAPGDRHGAAARRGHLGLRPAAGRQGAGPEPRGPLRRAAGRGQGRRGRSRLRARRRTSRSTSASASCWGGSWRRATS